MQRTIEKHDYPDFSVYKITTEAGFVWSFKMDPVDICLSAYYDGRMVCIDAQRKELIGFIYEGFWDYSLYPECNILDEYHVCLITKEMKDWHCIHSDVYKRCVMRHVLTSLLIPANTAVFVKTGMIERKKPMEVFLPEPEPRVLRGMGDVFLIS